MIIENGYCGHRYCGHHFLVRVFRPYLQCWRCEKPFGCLQLMLRLYLSDHLWRRVRVRVRDVRLVGIDVLMRGYIIYIHRKNKNIEKIKI